MKSLNSLVDPAAPQSHLSALRKQMIPGTSINFYEGSRAQSMQTASELKMEKPVAAFIAILVDTKKEEGAILNEARAYLKDNIQSLVKVREATGRAQPPVQTNGGIRPSGF